MSDVAITLTDTRVRVGMLVLASSLTISGTRCETPARKQGEDMISSTKAFKIAHDAISGRRFYEAPCDIVIQRDGNRYSVLFSTPQAEVAADAAPIRTEVFVDAESGSVQDIHGASPADPASSSKGLISGRRALDLGVEQLVASGATYDERWTVTVALQGPVYMVTFPVPETARAATRRADFALQVWIDARSGKTVEIRHAS
jgi:hypothetical protein